MMLQWGARITGSASQPSLLYFNDSNTTDIIPHLLLYTISNKRADT